MSKYPFEFPLSEYPDTFREAEAIGGHFGITAEIPSIEDILEWREGRRRFTRGYYRLVDGPELYHLQQGLASHFGVRHSVAYCSLQAALLELLELLQNRSAEFVLKVVSDSTYPDFSFLVESLQALRRPVIHALGQCPEALELGNRLASEVLVIALERPREWMESKRDWLNSVSSARVPLVVCTKSLNAFEEFPKPANYWVCSLDRELPDSRMQGGIVLSSNDRQMTELGEIRKKRGNILSLRSAAVLLEEPALPEIEAVKPQQNNLQSHFLKGGAEEQQAKTEELLLQRLSRLEQAVQTLLYPSGMSAVSSVLSMLRRPEKPRVIVLGLLYTDSYAFLEWRYSGQSDTALYLKTDEIAKLEQAIDERTACIFTETITNPLLQMPDLEALGRIASARKIPLVVDNTLATPWNCRPLEWGADFVIHSTSKYLSGSNNHGGGAVMIREPRWKWALELHHRQWGLGLAESESLVLTQNLEDFGERMERFNRNGKSVARFLQNHPEVEKVYHGSLAEQEDVSRSWLSDYGSVVSFVLRTGDLKGLRSFYDHLPDPLLKAPTLGSNQTLVCPYALLAHYHQPPSFFEYHGISRHLIRVATGCENDLEPVLWALNEGLNNTLND